MLGVIDEVYFFEMSKHQIILGHRREDYDLFGHCWIYGMLEMIHECFLRLIARA